MPIYKTNVKKDGLQQYRVRVNYTDSHGKAHSLTRLAYGLADAKQMEQELQRQYNEDKPSQKKMTVQELYDEYIKSKQNEVRATTMRTIKERIDKGTLPYLKDKSLAKITAPVIQDWKNTLSTLGLSTRSLQNYFTELRQMFNFAVRMGYMQTNPMTIVGNFSVKRDAVPKEKIQYYTADQFLKFISEAKKSAERKDTIDEWSYYVFFCIAFYTGARKGEIIALKWSDIEGNILHIRRSIHQKIKGIRNLETAPKTTKSIRDLQIPTPLLKILEEHKQRQMLDKKYSNDYRICGGIDTIKDSTIGKKNIEYAKSAGLPHIRVHDFRHSHASLLANEGINIQEIARRLGHSNVEVTWNTYSHLYPREEERAIAVLDKIF